MTEAPVTRDEINRLWADVKALTMLVAHDVGGRWGRDQVDRWCDNRIAALETTTTDPAVTANAVRALDGLAVRLRNAADAAGTGAPPSTPKR